MDFTEGTALEIIERLSTAYGVTTQKALAECLRVPAANVNNWIKRDSVPGSAFVKCALDTGSDLRWLTTGKLANANFTSDFEMIGGKALHQQVIASGGKPVLRRMLDAYKFRTQKELGDHLSISSGTISTWVRRSYFPGDVVVTCALETGVSLEWLAIGKATKNDVYQHTESESIAVLKRFDISSGQLYESGNWLIDFRLLSSLPKNCGIVEKGSESWLVDFGTQRLSNGRWLISIDGSHDIYDVVRLPGNKIQLSSKGNDFECGTDDVKCIAHVKKSIIPN